MWIFSEPPSWDPFNLDKWLKTITFNAVLIVLAAIFLNDLYRFLVFELSK
jgi:hypothetical protein